MRLLVLGCSLLLLAGAGCIHRRPKSPPGHYSAVPGLTDINPVQPQAVPPPVAAPRSNPNPQPAITPDAGIAGRIKSVNPTARFVILSFPPGELPAPDQQFSVYRGGQKVGVIKITNQKLNGLVVADILEGDAQEGDDVRGR